MTTSAPALRLVRLLIPVALCAAALGSSASGASSASDLAATIGVYPGFDRGDRFASHESLLGRNVPWAVHMAGDESPTDMRGSVWGQVAKEGAYLRQIASRTELVMTIPLAFGKGRVETEADRLRIGANLEETANGRWDADYRVVARLLIDGGFADAVIRLGHEFDGTYYPWSSRGNERAYVEAFRHVHDVLASESADFRFEWTGMRSTFSRFGPQAYPGDDYVDVVGMDIYYRQPSPLTTEVWTSEYRSALEFHRDFAVARGKPVAYSEWGVGLYDQPAFIDAMHGWFTSLPADGPGRLLYQSYFHSPKDGYDLNDNPMSRSRYAELFGVGAGVPVTPTTAVPRPVTTPPVTTPPVTSPPRVTTPPVTSPPVTAPPVTAPPVTSPPRVTTPPVTAPPRAAGPVSIGEVLSLTHADVCTIVGVDVIRQVMGMAPDPRTGTLPESFGPSCIFTGNGGIGVQFHRYGPQGLANLATMQGKVAVDLAVAGRQAVVSEYSAASQQLTVWLGNDTDPALVVYAATRDDAVTVAEAVLARMSGWRAGRSIAALDAANPPAGDADHNV